MTCLLIRCDASFSIGSGHVIRCRTLARELQRRGAAITFLCRRQPGDLIGLLEQEFPVLVLPDLPLASCAGLQGRELYSAWLGCSQEQDSAQCLEALAEADITSAAWLLVDHYGLDSTWEAHMLAGLTCDAPPKLLVIDDLADRPHQADLLLDQNFFGESTEWRYLGLVPPHCRQLLGPHYALLGPEYAQLHPLVPARTELRRVLVFFGGVDPANLTVQAVETLMSPELAHLAVDVVVGVLSPQRQVIENLAAQRAYTTMHDPLPSLAGLIARADLAIGAGGATTWERCCLGLASLCLTLADNQKTIISELDHQDIVQWLGDSCTPWTSKLKLSISKLILSEEQLYDWSSRCKSVVDGKGASRAAEALAAMS